jgi:hypothetical protein
VLKAQIRMQFLISVLKERGGLPALRGGRKFLPV